MKKDEFLSLLDEKLQVINTRERKDIIDEYRSHIEMKMKEGKSEEKAIEDFGDIDELVDDILDAYKINTDNVHQKSFDRKFNSFMDDMYDGFKRFVASFTSMEADDVIKLIFECFIILIFLFILRIPFEIISGTGAMLLRSLIGMGIGHLLAGIWRFILSIAYIAIFIVVFINLFRKRLYRYQGKFKDDQTVFDDFKSTLHGFTNGYHSQTRNDRKKENREQCKEDQKMSDEDVYEAQYHEEEEAQDDIQEDAAEQDPYEHVKKDASRTRRNYDTFYAEEKIGSFTSGLLKVFFCLIMIPFIFIIIGLSCAFGAMIVLSFQGVTLFGSYFLLAGGMIVTGAFLSVLYRVLWKGGRRS